MVMDPMLGQSLLLADLHNVFVCLFLFSSLHKTMKCNDELLEIFHARMCHIGISEKLWSVVEHLL